MTTYPDEIKQEIENTDWSNICRDPHITPDRLLRVCSRLKGHPGPCASDQPYCEWWKR